MVVMNGAQTFERAVHEGRRLGRQGSPPLVGGRRGRAHDQGRHPEVRREERQRQERGSSEGDAPKASLHAFFGWLLTAHGPDTIGELGGARKARHPGIRGRRRALGREEV